MKRMAVFGLTLLLALVAPTAVSAECKTANLAGNWRLMVLGEGGLDMCLMSLTPTGAATGTCKVAGAFTGNMTQAPSCKLTGTIMGKSLTGRTESIATSATTLKPGVMFGYIATIHTMVQGFRY